ncbi:MAG: tRNA-dihydrouridine synthase [Chloroflexi bacterium]|nr:tRNA-dihydrouridine synthase [Chloroflexota bacterium]
MDNLLKNKAEDCLSPQNFWDTLPRPIIGLAPMDGVGDQPFRYIQKKYGNPDIIYTEFTSVEALCHGDWQSMLNLLYDESQRPVIAQIYGRTPHHYRQVAVLLCELGFDGIDINMGCPAKSVANGGSGAGLIRTPDLAQQIIQAVKAGVEDWRNGVSPADCPNISAAFVKHVATIHHQLPAAYQARRAIPVSVKTRIGFEEPVVDAWIPNLLEMEPVAICVHGRTLRQAYSGQADWDQIGRAAELGKGTKTLILGNGDITSQADAQRRVNTYGVDGVLIGRASMGNPFIFHKETDAPEERVSGALRSQIALEHAQLFEQTFLPYGRYRFIPMRKHLAWYIREIRGANYLRAKLMQTTNSQEVEAILRQHSVLTDGVYQSLLPDKAALTPA